MKIFNWIKENRNGISILLVFVIIIILAWTGVLDFIFKIIMAILSGFRSGGSDNYTPGESFPF